MEHARTHTFVCYAHDDRDVVEDVQELKNLGACLWIDERISPGSVWRSEIVDALDSSEKVLYFVSGRSVNSSHCQREISYAMNRDIPITPVILEPTEYPADQRLHLHRVQAIDRTKLRRDKYLEALESAVSQRLASEQIEVEVASRDTATTTPTRSRPSIAVDPLVHLSRAAESELALAVSDTIVGGIADFGAWCVTTKETGTPTYRLTGTVQTTEEKTCVRVSLAASGGETIWSQQFDYESDLDPLVLQSRVGWEIAFGTVRQMSNHHARMARELQPADLTADDHFHLGLSQLEGVDPNSTVAAEHFKRATQLDGSFASPLWGQAHVELEAMTSGEVDTLEHHAARALELTRRLLKINPMSEISANTHARALWFSGRHDEAVVYLKRYSSMRDLPGTRSLLALILAANLDHAEAAMNLQRARDLFGTYPPAALLAVGLVPFAAGDYVTAAEHFRSLASAWPDPEAHIFLISALAGSSEPEAAKGAYEQYTRRFPEASTRQRLNLFEWCYPHFIDTMRTSLIESGWDGTT